MKLNLAIKISISILIGLIFLELSIRIGLIFLPNLMPPIQFGGAHPRNLIIPDKELGYLLNPSFYCKETNDYKEYRIDIKISSQGLRDYEHDLSKDTYRILAIGDSYTFGEGVELTDTYLSILEEKLKDKYGQKNIEIIKAGIPGYGTKQEIIFLKRLMPIFKPKIVIMGLLPQETIRLETPYTYCYGYIVESNKLDRLYLVSGKLYSSRSKNRFWGKLDAIIKHYYFTPQFMQARFKYLRNKFKKHKTENENIISIDYLKQKHASLFSLLRDFKKICLLHNAHPVIILIDSNPIEDNFIAQFTKATGIPTLSLYPFFKELSDKNISYHFPRDKHWNAIGHKTAGLALFDFLCANNIIKKD